MLKEVQSQNIHVMYVTAVHKLFNSDNTVGLTPAPCERLWRGLMLHGACENISLSGSESQS